MVMPMKKPMGKMEAPMGKMGKGKMPMMPMENELFGEEGDEGEVEDESIDAMFAEDEMGMSGSDEKLFSSLSAAGFSPTPEQLSEIKKILEGGGVAPKGLRPTESGMEADTEMM